MTVCNVEKSIYCSGQDYIMYSIEYIVKKELCNVQHGEHIVQGSGLCNILFVEAGCGLYVAHTFYEQLYEFIFYCTSYLYN